MKIIWFCLLFMFLFAFQSLNAQRERNYVYLFDCTQSMAGYGNSPDIWEDTKKYLKEEIARMDEYSTVHIIPFQGKLHPTITFEGNNVDFNKINSQFDKYIKEITNTNICAAWDEGIKLFDPDKDNYLFLLTDGEDNVHGVDAICERIRKWCGQYKNSHAFYVMLTPAARNKKILDAINACSNINSIPPDKRHIPFGTLTTSEITVNSMDLTPRSINFSIMGDFPASLQVSDPYFNVEIEDGMVKKGRAVVRVSLRKSIQELTEILNGTSVYEFKTQVQINGVYLLFDELTIKVINDPERLLEIPFESNVRLEKASYYPSFLFCKAKEQEHIGISLKLNFNNDAIKSQSTVSWELSDRNGENDFILIKDGEELNNGHFTTASNEKSIELSIVFNNGAKTGKRYFILKPVSFNNLERINSVPPNQYDLVLQSAYSTSMNPLLIGLIWFSILLVAAILVWLIILKPILFPTFKINSFSVIYPYNSTRRLRRGRKLICTGKHLKQSAINRWFTGKIIYEINPFWTTDWVILPKDKMSIKPQGVRDYAYEPYTGVLRRGEEYKVINQSTNEKLEVLIN